MTHTPTVPFAAQDDGRHTAPTVIVAEAYTAPDGSVYVHKDLVQVVDPWAVERHVPEPKGTYVFGDVQSWAAYIHAHGESSRTFCRWQETGFFATLDHHDSQNADPGRNQWHATLPFVFTPQWMAWSALADGQPRSQKQLVEALEDLAEDIVAPDAAALMTILRDLRATASAKAETTLRPDGTSRVVWTKDAQVTGETDLPSTMGIMIPVLKGHTVTDESGTEKRVVYPVTVRIRCSVNGEAAVQFRLSIPNAARLLEDVYADRVAAARAALGDQYQLFRAG